MDKKFELPVYVCDTQRIEKMSRAMLMRNFPHHQIIICTAGEGIVCAQSELEQRLPSGSAVLVEQSAMFSVRPAGKFVSIKRIAFNGNFASDYMQYFGFNVASIFRMTPEADSCAEKVMELFGRGDDKNASVQLYELIGLCGEVFVQSQRVGESETEKLGYAGYEYIKENIWRTVLDIEDFARANNVDKTYMDKVFMQCFGKNSEELICFYRMEFAKYAVFLSGATPVHRYCRECGFETVEEFEREFKKYTGVSVKEYIDITGYGV